MSASRVKVGIVGLGRWAKVLTRASKKSDKLQIVAGYSRSEEKRQAFAGEMGVPAVPDLPTMRADPEIKGVIITSAKKTFFAGGDLRTLIQAGPEHAKEFEAGVTEIKRQLRVLETLGKPAGVRGFALCDINPDMCVCALLKGRQIATFSDDVFDLRNAVTSDRREHIGPAERDASGIVLRGVEARRRTTS